MRGRIGEGETRVISRFRVFGPALVMIMRGTDAGTLPGRSRVSTLMVTLQESSTEKMDGTAEIQGYFDGIVPRRVPVPAFRMISRSSMIPLTDQVIRREVGINLATGPFVGDR